jgi:RNA polymerase sigma factor (sigma-70 family)
MTQPIPADLPSEDLLEQVRTGKIDEQEGYRILFERTTPYILWMIRKQAPSLDDEETSDLAALVWGEIWRNLETYHAQQSASFRTWATTIARNRTVDYLRHINAKSAPTIESLDALPVGSSQTRIREASGSEPLEEIVARELQKAALQVLMEVDPFDRTLYLLYLNFDITHAELAEIASNAKGAPVTERGVQNRIYRTRERIFNKLEEQGILDRN